MKLQNVKSKLLMIAVFATTWLSAQDNHGDMPAQSNPCIPSATAWFLGGNIIPQPLVMTPTTPLPVHDIGTCNNFPFILKANNKFSVFILPNSNVGIGLNNSSPAAALDIRSSIPTSQSNFRIYGDFYGNLESSTHINMNYAVGSDFRINEGPIYTGGTYSGTNRMKIFANTGYVLFGIQNMYTPSTRFHITNDVNANQGSATGALYGAAVEQNIVNSSSMVGNWVIGVSGRVSAPNNLYANGIGIEGVSSVLDNNNINSNTNIGVDGIASGGNVAYGIRGRGAATNDSEVPNSQSKSIGVSGEAIPSQFGDGFGIEGYGMRNPGLFGANIYGGLFWGDVHVTGDLDVAGNGVFNTSDKKFKDQIKPIETALDKIMLLTPSTYFYKKEEFPGMNFPSGEQMGLIAQDVEKLFPGLTKQIHAISYKDKDGKVLVSNPDYKAVNYVGLIPLVISGVQEQQKQIQEQTNLNQELKNQIDNQQHQINELKVLIQSLVGITGINATNTTETGLRMSQNEPNPFTHQTIVKFTLPNTITNAFMAIYDLTGKQLSTMAIYERGDSSISITSDKLAAGIYIYSIVADGTVIDSKRMIVSDK